VKRLLLLYPQPWRERYQSEMEAVLEGMPFNLRAAFDLVACAADAHLHPVRALRGRVPLLLQVALLLGVGLLVLPPLGQVLERVAGIPTAGLAYSLVPFALPLLAAVLGWRAGWGLAAWFFGLVTVHLAVGNGQLLSLLIFSGGRALEPLRETAAGWHPGWFRLLWPASAVLVVALGAVAALVLRRLGTAWPIGLGIGMALVVTGDVWILYEFQSPIWSYLPPHPDWFRLLWLVTPAQALAWGALTAALLRRAGLPWWAGLVAGTVLWLLLGSSRLGPTYPIGAISNPYLQLWQAPELTWAIVIAVVAARRAAEPAPREAAQC